MSRDSKAPRDDDWKDESKTAKERVEAWQRYQGTSLEFEAAAVLLRNHFDCFHGYHLPQDTPGDPPLEVDVLAYRNAGFEPRVVSFDFVVECKHAPTPWVVFTQEYSPPTYDLLLSKLAQAADFVIANRRKPSPPVADADHFGFSVTALREHKGSSNQRDLAYEALDGVARRAILRLKQMDSPEGPHGPMICGIVRPLIVLRGALCVAKWNPEGAVVEVAEVPSVSIHWRGAAGGPVNVDLVRIDALDSHLKRVDLEILERLEQLRKVATEIDAAIRKSSLKELGLGKLGRHELPSLLKPLAASDSTSELLELQTRRTRKADDPL